MDNMEGDSTETHWEEEKTEAAEETHTYETVPLSSKIFGRPYMNSLHAHEDTTSIAPTSTFVSISESQAEETAETDRKNEEKHTESNAWESPSQSVLRFDEFAWNVPKDDITTANIEALHRHLWEVQKTQRNLHELQIIMALQILTALLIQYGKYQVIAQLQRFVLTSEKKDPRESSLRLHRDNILHLMRQMKAYFHGETIEEEEREENEERSEKARGSPNHSPPRKHPSPNGRKESTTGNHQSNRNKSPEQPARNRHRSILAQEGAEVLVAEKINAYNYRQKCPSPQFALKYDKTKAAEAAKLRRKSMLYGNTYGSNTSQT